jgi:hypothetical protein
MPLTVSRAFPGQPSAISGDTPVISSVAGKQHSTWLRPFARRGFRDHDTLKASANLAQSRLAAGLAEG